jgi:hypothetical protein
MNYCFHVPASDQSTKDVISICQSRDRLAEKGAAASRQRCKLLEFHLLEKRVAKL